MQDEHDRLSFRAERTARSRGIAIVPRVRVHGVRLLDPINDSDPLKIDSLRSLGMTQEPSPRRVLPSSHFVGGPFSSAVGP